MGTQTVKIAYPAGLSISLYPQLMDLASGADTFAGQASTGESTITQVTNDMNSVMGQIMANNKGQAATALDNFWGGGGAAGQSGSSARGVIADAKNAGSVLSTVGTGTRTLSGAIGDQATSIYNGLSVIDYLQANPGMTFTQSQAQLYEQQISAMLNALQALNESFLGTASSIDHGIQALNVKPGVCASGVTIGETAKKVLKGAALIGAGAAAGYTLGKRAGSTSTGGGSGSGSGGGGGGEPPVTTGGDGGTGGGEEPSGEGSQPGKLSKIVQYSKENIFTKRNAATALIVGTLNTMPAIVGDLAQGKDPLTDPSVQRIFAANLASGFLAAPLLGAARGLAGKFGWLDTEAGAVLKTARNDANVSRLQALLGGGLLGSGVSALLALLSGSSAQKSTTPAPTPGSTPVPGQTPTPGSTPTPAPTFPSGQPAPTPGNHYQPTPAPTTGAPFPTPTGGSPTLTPTPTGSSSPSPTPTPTGGSPLPTPTPTGGSPTPTPTGSSSPTPTPTPTGGSPTPTPTPTGSSSPSPTPTPTGGSPLPTPTPTGGSPTPTPTGSSSPTPTPTGGSPWTAPWTSPGGGPSMHSGHHHQPSVTPSPTANGSTPAGSTHGTATPGNSFTAGSGSSQYPGSGSSAPTGNAAQGQSSAPTYQFVPTSMGNSPSRASGSSIPVSGSSLPAGGGSSIPAGGSAHLSTGGSPAASSNAAQGQSSAPTYQFVPTSAGNSSSPTGGGSPVPAGGSPVFTGGGSPITPGGGAPLSTGGSPVVPGAAGSPPAPPTKIVGIAQGQFELQYWTGQQYSTAFVSPMQLPHWLQQHDIAALTIPTAPQAPSTSAYAPTILGVTQGEFQVQYWNGEQYSTTLVQPMDLLPWLEQQGAYTVDVQAPAIPVGAGAS